MAGEEERNFRLPYYDKILKGVDLKAIDKLLEERPVNLTKLQQYVLKFGLTSTRRVIAWKTLLGITARTEPGDEYIENIHKETCNFLESALKSLSMINGCTKNSTKLLLMYILEIKDLSFDIDKQLASQDNVTCNAIAMSFENFGFPFVDTYWLMRTFLLKLEEQRQNILKMAQKFTIEDKDLEKHLEETGAIDVLPISVWFCRCFSGIIHDSCLVRLWDRLVSGSFKILPIIAKYTLLELKDDLLTISSSTEIRRKLLEPTPLSFSENITRNVLETK